MGPDKLARTIGVPVDEAIAKIEQFLHVYPGIDRFTKESVEIGRKWGYAFTVLGRRRNVADINSHRRFEQGRGERQATNTGIQGCLPAETRVHTNVGMLPIGEIDPTGYVWTGLKFAPYTRLSMGKARRVTLCLANGQELKCDDRHKVLCFHGGAYDFRSVTGLHYGDEVCMSHAVPMTWNSGGTREEHYYVLGTALQVDAPPTSIWSASLQERRAFMVGVLSGHGQLHSSAPLLKCTPETHRNARDTLAAIQLIAHTVGIESTLQCDQDDVWFLRLANGVFNTPHREPGAYARRAVSGVIVHEEQAEMYTLSVEDRTHRFDAEGIISKNSAADVVKMAQIFIDKLGYDVTYECDPVLTVHDELVFECPDEYVGRVMPDIRFCMEHPFSRDLAVRLEAEGGKGRSWAQAK
jgi:hypothetical protein